MAPLLVRTVTLTPHPETRNDAVRGLAARISRTSGGLIAVTYILEGQADRLLIPPPRPHAVGKKLWEHTCFELFIGRPDTEAYHEFNFSPSGEWAVYSFARYREPAVLDASATGADLDPELAWRSGGEKLELNGLIRLDRLSPEHSDAPLSIGLAAIIEDRNGVLSYWALTHSPGRPDFHQAGSFALALDAVRD